MCVCFPMWDLYTFRVPIPPLTAWLPRLERLAELRSLDDFEKNVLLTLTGSMVSRNLRDSTDSYSDAILGRRINIGALIGLFCDGLEEQIHSRVYFYKNSKLVSVCPCELGGGGGGGDKL